MSVLPLCAALFLLTSCIEVNERLTLKGDGSGTVELSYQVARVAVGVTSDGNPAASLPLPINPNDFRTKVNDVKGLTLEGLTPLEGIDRAGFKATVRFADVSDLDRLPADPGTFGVTLNQSGSTSTFVQQLYPGNPDGVDPDTLALAKDLFGGYRLTFSLRAPKPIQHANRGTVAKDRMNATYTTTIPDIIQSKSPVFWEVSW